MLNAKRVRARLRELTEVHELGESVAPRLEALLSLFENDPAAPTTITDPLAAVEVHVADALDGLILPEVRSAERFADLGAGAGIPGLVLAAALPDAAVALVESVGRKCAFLDVAVDVMGLDNVSVVNARAEGWPAGIARHDVVTARAVALLPVLLEYAAPLLVDGGAFVAWKGRRDAAEEADGVAAAAELGLSEPVVHAVPPRPGADEHHLHVYLKVRPTPARYPRREGMARKRPLRAST